MTTEQISALLAKPTITPEELYQSKILPLGRNGIYNAISRGEIEAIGLGRKKLIIAAALRRKLGLDPASA